MTIIKRHVTTWTRSIRLTSLKAIRLRRIKSFVSWWSIFYSANNYSPIIPLSTIFSSFLRKVSKNNSIESIILFHQFLKKFVNYPKLSELIPRSNYLLTQLLLSLDNKKSQNKTKLNTYSYRFDPTQWFQYTNQLLQNLSTRLSKIKQLESTAFTTKLPVSQGSYAFKRHTSNKLTRQHYYCPIRTGLYCTGLRCNRLSGYTMHHLFLSSIGGAACTAACGSFRRREIRGRCMQQIDASGSVNSKWG